MSGKISGLAKNSVIYGFGTMVTRFVSLLLLPFFTAHLTPSDYGILALLALIGQVIQPVFSLGLSAGMGPCYFEGDNEKTKAAAVWGAFLMLLISSSLLFVISIFSREWLSQVFLQSPSYSHLIMLSISGVAVSNLAIPFTQRMQFEGKALPFVILTTSSTIITIFLSVFMVIFFGMGVRGMVIAQLSGTIISTFLFFLYIVTWTPFVFKTRMLWELLRLGIPLVPSFAFLFILMHANKYLLQWFSGLEAVGIYSVGFNFGAVMSLFTGSFQTAWFPYFMSFMERTEEAGKLFGRIFSYYVAGFGSLVVIFFVFARGVVTLLTQPPFHSSYRVVGFVAMAHFLSGIFSLLLPPVYFANDVKVVSLIQGAACLFYLPVALVMVRCFNSLGAAISLSFGFFLMTFFSWIWIETHKKYIRIKYEYNRIQAYALFILIMALITLADRCWGWKLELLFISIMLIGILLFAVFWLNADEKSWISKIPKSTLRGNKCFKKF